MAGLDSPPLLQTTALGRPSNLSWLLAYLTLSLLMTLHCKILFQWYQFKFPWIVTALHCLSSVLGTRVLRLCGQLRPPPIRNKEWWVMVGFSMLYTVNIAVCNISLEMVTVPFHQVVRGMVPIFTVLLNIVLFNNSYSALTYVVLVWISVGVGLATFGDYYFTRLGLLLTLLGTLLAAVKTIATNTILVGQFNIKLSPLALLYHLSPLTLMQSLAWAYATGEVARCWEYLGTHFALFGGGDPGLSLSQFALMILVNGTIAFLLNYVSFMTNKRTSALTMTILGNTKVVIMVYIACNLFNLRFNSTSVMGIAVALAGGLAYSLMQHNNKGASAPAQTRVLPTSSTSLMLPK
ncbi:hypothetical protein EV182_000269 [Spiromyces aspiralis]|uniref:Uncharacterized protein n=1 Tax=Spiromyces aspiralis TaxID=68401 RepID=A0ACC1HKZ6_9FUNG|nr:hypothetical protein EV182_000269 [Spiromyces aspiralis]